MMNNKTTIDKLSNHLYELAMNELLNNYYEPIVDHFSKLIAINNTTTHLLYRLEPPLPFMDHYYATLGTINYK